MTLAIQKFAGRLLDWIPDISRVPVRRQVAMGIAASIIFHLLAVLVLLFASPLIQRRLDFGQSQPPLPSIELIVMPPPPRNEPVPFQIEAAKERPFLDSRGLAKSRDAALNPVFESDEDMTGASELPGTGDIPLPSQAGRFREFNAFKSQKSLLGSPAQPFSEQRIVLRDASQPAEPAAHYKPEPRKAAAEPDPPVDPAEPREKTEESRELAATQKRLKQVAAAAADEVAIANSTDAAAKAELERPRPVPWPRQQLAKLTTPGPRTQSGYQPELEKNRIEGSISNRGKAAVDAVSTPLAKYRKQVNDAIGSRWYHYVRERMDLIAAGSARISFAINEQGRVSGLKIDSNTSNQSFAEVCMRSVSEAEIAPPPRDMTIPLKNQRIECSLTFTFYNL